MKKVCGFLILVSLILTVTSCKEEEYTTYPKPTWSVVYADRSVSLSGVIELPTYLKPYMTKDDQLGAFIDGTCCGLATYVDGQFYINVLGTPSETKGITFKYYSSKTQYMYEEKEKISFQADKIIGTADDPYVLTLTLL